MKTNLRLLVAVLLLLSPGFGQEPNVRRTHVKEEPPQPLVPPTADNGTSPKNIPIAQPEAFPVLDLPLGDLARQLRGAHASTPKAKVVLGEEDPRQELGVSAASENSEGFPDPPPLSD